jgi:phospholipase A1
MNRPCTTLWVPLAILLLIWSVAVADAQTARFLPDPPASQVPLLDNIITGPASREASTQPLFGPENGFQKSVAEFIGHFSACDPIYIIAGPVNPLVKFQFSFKYQLFNDQSPVAKAVPLLSGLNFSYTQLSLWELDKPSAPFFDTNYMPEFFYSNEDLQWRPPGVSQLGIQTGYAHDSNGQAGPASRSINMLFFRPIITFGDVDQFHFYVAPRLYTYIGDLSNNPDIYHYRGYCDLRAVVGWRQGLELSALARVGSAWNRGGVQLDLTYPLRDLLNHNLDVYVDAQYFYGYGESLLTYNHKTDAFRIGFALAR